MSYASQLASISRTPCTLVEIDLDTCSLTYGAGACTATGTSGNECYNTYPTCHDKTNFAKSTKTYQFTSIDTAIPFPGPRPYLSNTTYLATEIKDSSTTKARIKVDMVDEPDTDIGIDPYVANRTSVQGTFWKKLLARNPNYAGRPVRQYKGFTDPDYFLNLPTDDGLALFLKCDGDMVDSSDNEATGSWQAAGYSFSAGIKNDGVELLGNSSEYYKLTSDIILTATDGYSVSYWFREDEVMNMTLGSSLENPNRIYHQNASRIRVHTDSPTATDFFDIPFPGRDDGEIHHLGFTVKDDEDDSTDYATNGTFDSDLTGWNDLANCVSTWIAGEMSCVLTATYSGAYQLLDTIVGQRYTVSAESISASVQHNIVAYSSEVDGIQLSESTWRTTPSVHAFTFVAISPQTMILLRNTASASVTLVWDNVKIYKGGSYVVPYIDGVQGDDIDLSEDVYRDLIINSIGSAWATPGTYEWKGLLDEIRLYQEDKTPEEMVNLYTIPSGDILREFKQRFAGTLDSIKLSKGIVKIECVDLLASLSDFTIAAEIEAELNADITVDAVAMTLTDTDELTGSTGYGKLNDEIFYYGAKDDTTNTLSSLTRGMFGTTATTHDEGDSYQPVRYFEPDHPFDHLDTLIFTDAEIASARKNTSAWTQYRDFPETPGNIFSAIIHEPTKVSDLVWEIVDLMNLSLWQDEDQKISVRKNLANEPARTYTTITDTENIIINSGSVDLNPESRITRTILYWDRDAVADDGKTTSYNTIHIAIDADAEGANEYNDIVEDKIFCRWLRQGYIQSELVEDFAEMLVKRRLFQRRDAQEIITYRVELKDEATKTGDTIKLTTDEISEIDGTDLTEREYMVVKRTPKGGELEYKVKRMPRQKLCYIGDQFGAATLTGTDTDMSGSNNWSAVGGSLATFEVDGVTYPDKMYIEGNGAADFCWLGAVTVSGEIYKISLKARLATGASTTIRVGANITTAGSYIEITPTGTEQTFEGVISASGTTLYIGLATPGFSGVGFEIDDVQVWQQVDWAAASDSEKEYGFIADTAGNMDSTNKGYHIF